MLVIESSQPSSRLNSALLTVGWRFISYFAAMCSLCEGPTRDGNFTTSANMLSTWIFCSKDTGIGLRRLPINDPDSAGDKTRFAHTLSKTAKPAIGELCHIFTRTFLYVCSHWETTFHDADLP